MSKSPLARLAVTALSVMFFMVGAVVVEGQTNLLDNPGFEAGFRTVSGDQPRSVANDWTPYHMPQTSGMPSFQNTQPKYIASSAAGTQGIQPRVRSGNDSQIYYSFFETHDGGIYQQVSVPNGAELRFSIYAHIWSSTFADVNESEDPGGVVFRVGIDPLGGTDPNASSVVYSTPAVFYDTFRQYSVIATAERETVTVFIRSTFGDPVQNTYVYVDDAVLELTEAPPPTATNTNVPTETPEPSNTPEPSSTSEPSSTPAETEEATEQVTSTTVPTATAEPVIQDPTPTRETGVLLPTATPIGAGVVGTSPPAVGGVDGNRPLSETFPGTVIHTVRSGDTVGALSVLYGSSNEAIIEANGLGDNALIFRGQALVIPVRLRPVTATPTNTPIVVIVTATEEATDFGTGGPVSGGNYVVQRGDTLSTIARQFNTTVATLVQLNGIANPNRIFAGQSLTVPRGDGTVAVPAQPTAVVPTNQTTVAPTAIPVAPAPSTYVVQPGDNLYRVALRLGVPIQRLADVNGIFNYNLIFIGQILTVPQ